MSALSSSVVILGDLSLPKVDGLETQAWPFHRLQAPLQESLGMIDVFVCDSSDQHFRYNLDQLKTWCSLDPATQFILFVQDESSSDLFSIAVNDLKVIRFLRKQNLDQFPDFLVEAIEKARGIRQNIQLEKLVQNQKTRLHLLYSELEDRVEKRQKYLLDARRKTFVANARWEAVRKATIVIHEARSVAEMERLLNDALSASMQLAATRIIFHPQDLIFKEQNQHRGALSFFQANLIRADQPGPFGSVFFLRAKARPFLRDEIDFLTKIAEIISLAIDRLSKLEQMEVLNGQWQATFNAISDPVSLIDHEYNVLQANAAFDKARIIKTDSRKCYELMFGRKSPCPQCILGNPFRLQNQERVVEVQSQSLDLDARQGPIYVNHYQDITEEQRLERKLMDTARFAELGTIGSSIAHELNNPLGGILSFVQLLRMDKGLDQELKIDLAEMENGVKRCQEIIQNLLDFSRSTDHQQRVSVDLMEVINRTLKLLKLRTKAMGVQFQVREPATPILVTGSANLLSQALQQVLENFFLVDLEDTISRSISLDLSMSSDKATLLISDLGPDYQSKASTGAPLAQQILHDHGSTLEFNRPENGGQTAKITFTRPVFKT